ncbi:MAG: hypothetical protein HQ592_10885 [Planctomycetes bacterium]|nr:hypothetical protein [Planctomycetota bacterium]
MKNHANHIHGDRDEVVPIGRNSGELAQRYQELGGEITLNVVKGGGHDHWAGWFQCQELVDFAISHACRDRPNKPDASDFGNPTCAGHLMDEGLCL